MVIKIMQFHGGPKSLFNGNKKVGLSYKGTSRVETIAVTPVWSLEF